MHLSRPIIVKPHHIGVVSVSGTVLLLFITCRRRIGKPYVPVNILSFQFFADMVFSAVVVTESYLK